MYCVNNDTAMLSAERLCELPLEVRVYIANMDIEAYIRMYLYDTRFRDHARGAYAIDDFIERFVVTQCKKYKRYRLSNYIYHKYDDGSSCWSKNGKKHKVGGPAMMISNGHQEWCIDGKLHRDDGPALLYADGTQEWFVDNKLHRVDGPAIIYTSGYKAYYQHGELHRLDGPAIIRADGREEYWEYGKWIR